MVCFVRFASATAVVLSMGFFMTWSPNIVRMRFSMSF